MTHHVFGVLEMLACGRRWFWMFLCFAVSSCSVAAAEIDEAGGGPQLTAADLEAWLDGFVPFALEQSNIAGAVVVVVKDGQVLMQRGYGYADVARKTPMDPRRTVLGVGSVSKVFAWTAVMQQVEQGKLDLDRDINEYLDFHIPPKFGKPITVRHLMTHSAGFEDRGFKRLPEGVTPRSLGDYLKGTSVPTRIFPPGEVPAYSNYSTMLAGYIVERVSGEKFVDYVQRHILAPLGMEQSSFERPIPQRLREMMANSYGLATDEPLVPDNEEPAGDPSGHLSATAIDMARFMLAHLQEGRYGDYALLQPRTTRLMQTTDFTPLPGATTMSLGFFRQDRNGHRVIGHSGDLAGFHADMQLLPDEGVGLFTAVNSDGLPLGVLSVSNALRTALFRGFVDRYFPGAAVEDEPTAATAKEHARIAAGEYEMSRRPTGDFLEAVYLFLRYLALDYTVKAHEDGTIETPALLAFEDGNPQRWREVGDFVWREVGGNARLVMKIEGGEVQSFVTDDIITTMLNQRVPFLWSATLNVPLFLAAVGILLLTTLLWPIKVLVRKHYGAVSAEDDRVARARFWTRVSALTAVVYVVGWLAVVAIIDAPGTAGQDHWVRLMQAIGVLCIGAAMLTVRNTWRVWRSATSWWAKASSLAVSLALIEIVWFSFAFHLLSVNLNY